MAEVLIVVYMRGFENAQCRVVLVRIMLSDQFLSYDINPCVQILTILSM